MVLGIDHVDPALAVHNQGPRARQAPRLSPGPSPDAERAALGRELLHPMVAVLHDVEIAFRSEREVVGIRHLARALARTAPVANQLALASKDLDAVVAGIRDI